MKIHHVAWKCEIRWKSSLDTSPLEDALVIIQWIMLWLALAFEVITHEGENPRVIVAIAAIAVITPLIYQVIWRRTRVLVHQRLALTTLDIVAATTIYLLCRDINAEFVVWEVLGLCAIRYAYRGAFLATGLHAFCLLVPYFLPGWAGITHSPLTSWLNTGFVADIVITLAIMLAVAYVLRRSELHEHERRKIAAEGIILSMVQDISAAIGASLDIDVLIERTGIALSRFLPIDEVVLALYFPETDEVEIRAFWPEKLAAFPPGRVPAGALKLTPQIHFGQTTISNLTGDLTGRGHELVRLGYQTVARLPLLVGSRCTGVLALLSRQSGVFDDTQRLDVLRHLADQIAGAVENGRLYQSLRERMLALREAQMQLVQAERLSAIGELAANVAHEINNPLASLLLATSLTQTELEADDPRQTDLAIIEQEAVNARGIVRGLLDAAHQNKARHVLASPPRQRAA